MTTSNEEYSLGQFKSYLKNQLSVNESLALDTNHGHHGHAHASNKLADAETNENDY